MLSLFELFSLFELRRYVPLETSSDFKATVYYYYLLTMRVSVTAAFSQYLMDNSTIYPCSNLRPMRSSFFCKWVMLVEGDDRGAKMYFPVLANSLPNAVLLELISSERGVPLPPELSEIMDMMYWWGKKMSVQWYDDVVYMLGMALDNDIEEDRKVVVRAMISLQVKAEIHVYFAVDSVATELLWIDWVFWFNHASYLQGWAQVLPRNDSAQCSLVHCKRQL
jgi:hypothetical protein